MPPGFNITINFEKLIQEVSFFYYLILILGISLKFTKVLLYVMIKKEVTMIITLRDGKKIDLISWQASKEPKAHILLIHGMAEHIERYEAFASFLLEKGYNVYGYDQRGHGKTAGNLSGVGYFDLGWSGVVGDVKEVVDQLPKNAPIILFGHSMGSFIVRDYIRNFSESVDGVILSGTSSGNGLQSHLVTMISGIMGRFKGNKSPNKMIADIMNKSCLSRINDPRTSFDWLSRDKTEVDLYVNDPYCGAVFSNKFYRELFPAIERVNRLKSYQGMNLPVFILSGAEDPVGNYGLGVKKVFDLFNKITEPVEMKLYEGGRHEMLNELNREDVYADIEKWLSSRF